MIYSILLAQSLQQSSCQRFGTPVAHFSSITFSHNSSSSVASKQASKSKRFFKRS